MYFHLYNCTTVRSSINISSKKCSKKTFKAISVKASIFIGLATGSLKMDLNLFHLKPRLFFSILSQVQSVSPSSNGYFVAT